jgi:hypothetical protein
MSQNAKRASNPPIVLRQIEGSLQAVLGFDRTVEILSTVERQPLSDPEYFQWVISNFERPVGGAAPAAASGKNLKVNMCGPRTKNIFYLCYAHLRQSYWTGHQQISKYLRIGMPNPSLNSCPFAATGGSIRCRWPLRNQNDGPESGRIPGV